MKAKYKEIFKISIATITVITGLILTFMGSNGIIFIGLLLIGAGAIYWTIFARRILVGC